MSAKDIFFNLFNFFALFILIQSCAPASLKAESVSKSLTNSPSELKTASVKTKLYCSPKNKQAMDNFRKGVKLAEKKEFKEAVKLYLKAIEIDPGFCEAMDNLGVIYQKAGKTDEAIYWHQKSIDANFNDSSSHMNLAADFRLENRLRDAADEYNVMKRIDPDNPEGYFGLGSVYLTLGKNEEALQELKIAEKMYREKSSPYVTQARYSMGLAHFNLEDCAAAKSYLEPIYLEFENDPNMNYTLGVCYLRSNETEKGKIYLLKAKSQGMDSAENILEKIENGEIK